MEPPVREDVARDAATSRSGDPFEPIQPEPSPEPVGAQPSAASERPALGDIIESQPPVEVPRAPGKLVEGNKSAFETWIRQLGGKE